MQAGKMLVAPRVEESTGLMAHQTRCRRRARNLDPKGRQRLQGPTGFGGVRSSVRRLETATAMGISDYRIYSASRRRLRHSRRKRGSGRAAVLASATPALQPYKARATVLVVEYPALSTNLRLFCILDLS